MAAVGVPYWLRIRARKLELASAAELQHVIIAHLEASKAAWGTEPFKKIASWVPKHHQTMHLPLQLEQHGLLLNCFVHERKHKVVKEFAQYHRNTASYEYGLIADCYCQHLYDLCSWDKFDRSVGLRSPVTTAGKQHAQMLRLAVGAPDDSVVNIARRARVSKSEVCGVRDVALCSNAPTIAVCEICFFRMSWGDL